MKTRPLIAPPTPLTQRSLSQESIPPDAECWVARTVYGESNPDWMIFRGWLRTEAPAWFHSMYVRHGERVARWIAPHGGIKAVLRMAMDRVVAPRRGI